MASHDDASDNGVPPELPGPRREVEVVTHWLEMRTRPVAPVPPPPAGVAVVRADPPTVRFYRYLYDSVGEPWHWYDRRMMPADELAALLGHERNEVHVLWQHGVPAGYSELDRRISGEVELAYFGLFPEAIGRGLGSWLLRWSIAEAWRLIDTHRGVPRVWVHTCSLDHPAALGVYLAAGFKKYDETRHRQLIVDRDAGGNTPLT